VRWLSRFTSACLCCLPCLVLRAIAAQSSPTPLEEGGNLSLRDQRRNSTAGLRGGRAERSPTCTLPPLSPLTGCPFFFFLSLPYSLCPVASLSPLEKKQNKQAMENKHPSPLKRVELELVCLRYSFFLPKRRLGKHSAQGGMPPRLRARCSTQPSLQSHSILLFVSRPF
jgi:hypothetical protein